MTLQAHASHEVSEAELLPTVGWSRYGADLTSLEMLDASDAPARAWSFVWPARVLVQARGYGVRFVSGIVETALSCGDVLVIEGPGTHVTVKTERGASFRAIFEPPARRPSSGNILRARSARVLPALELAGNPSELLRRAALALPTELPWGRIDMRLARACDYIERNLAREMSLDDLAAVAKIHRCHFCRVFGQQVGMSPLRFRAHMRVAKARELLATGLDCVAVAYEVGYCDQSHFNRSFRDITGTTPGAYARALQRPTIDWRCAA